MGCNLRSWGYCLTNAQTIGQTQGEWGGVRVVFFFLQASPLRRAQARVFLGFRELHRPVGLGFFFNRFEDDKNMAFVQTTIHFLQYVVQF